MGFIDWAQQHGYDTVSAGLDFSNGRERPQGIELRGLDGRMVFELFKDARAAGYELETLSHGIDGAEIVGFKAPEVLGPERNTVATTLQPEFVQWARAHGWSAQVNGDAVEFYGTNSALYGDFLLAAQAAGFSLTTTSGGIGVQVRAAVPPRRTYEVHNEAPIVSPAPAPGTVIRVKMKLGTQRPSSLVGKKVFVPQCSGAPISFVVSSYRLDVDGGGREIFKLHDTNDTYRTWINRETEFQVEIVVEEPPAAPVAPIIAGAPEQILRSFTSAELLAELVRRNTLGLRG